MTIEQTAIRYVRLRRLRIRLRAERFRLMHLCTETDYEDDAYWSGFSECLASGNCDYHDDRPIDSWDTVPPEAARSHRCIWCRMATRAEVAYMRTAHASGAALRLLERKINSATAKSFTKGML